MIALPARLRPAALSLPALIFGLALTGCKATSPDQAPVEPAAAKAVAEAQAEAPLEYVEFVTGTLPATAPLPLVVAIHGLGDDPQRFKTIFQFFNIPARIIVPRAPIPHGPGFSWFPVGAFSGETVPEETKAGILKSAARIVALAESLSREKPTKGKPIVTGFSQGGILSYAIALNHPEAIAAALPIAGALPDSMWKPGKTTMPTIHAFHGGTDRRVPYEKDKALVAHLKAGGAAASIQTFRVGHRINGPMRAAWADALVKELDKINPPAVDPSQPILPKGVINNFPK